ncbi:MAG: 1-deoxy-D-xylulose-5-phosphate synthase [Ruthenibacterium sp.]
MPLLEDIHSPEDVKKLNMQELDQLSAEIRAFLIESVSQTGGHLSSNLGTIELTLALHKVFTTPRDELVFDVGHQCYTHKIVTGRKDKFDTLRMLDGISGFPSPKESKHDTVISGHGNTSISTAIGLATAKKLKGELGKVIAIVGDGAFTGGMIYEGMNNIRTLNNLIVVLNDNKMSISKNVGSVAQYLTKLRTNPRYFKVKRNVESILNAIPVIGNGIKLAMQTIKSAFRRIIYHSTMFEEMGFQYVGPMDGHNISKLCTLFSAYQQEQTSPLFAHIVTVKGRGFEPAEQNPGEFHGVSAFDVNHITDPDVAPDSSFSTLFGETLAELADDDTRICAITAAMKYGTGLQFFYKRHKERFFDVGMAEQHAVTFAAGLATNGMRPVVSIYSTFLQRSYDQIIHDVSLRNLNVLLAVDRAGFVPGDGETHQGIYDAAFLSQITGMTIISPANYAELTHWLALLMQQDGMRAIRYPRGCEQEELAALGCSGKEYDVYSAAQKADIALVTFGSETAEALDAVALAAKDGLAVDCYKLCKIHPLPDGLCEQLLPYKAIVFAEEGIQSGGINEHMASTLSAMNYAGKYRPIGIAGAGMTHANVSQLRHIFKLDAAALSHKLKEAFRESTS